MLSIIFAHLVVALCIFVYILVQSRKAEKNATNIALLAWVLPPIAAGRWAEMAEDNDLISKKYLFYTAFSRVNLVFFMLLIYMFIYGDPLSLWAAVKASAGFNTNPHNGAEMVGTTADALVWVIGAGLSFFATVILVLLTALVGGLLVFIPITIRGDRIVPPQQV
jgi:hypothetical protein